MARPKLNIRAAVVGFCLVCTLELACITLPPTESDYSRSAAGKSQPTSISGAVNRAFSAFEIGASKVGGDVRINIMPHHDQPCGLSVQFPQELRPGTYSIDDRAHSSDVDVFVEYSNDCKTEVYLSVAGLLYLKSVGKQYSGDFEVKAVHHLTPSKTIRIWGNFTEVPSPQDDLKTP